MESLNRKYLPAVDHLRAFAVLLIVFYHSYHLLYPRMVLHRAWDGADWVHTGNFFLAAILEGHTAAALFLVISGFVLTYGTLEHAISYRGFFRNRLLRFFPLFFLILMTGACAFRSQFQLANFVTWILQFGYLTAGPPYGAWTAVSWTVSIQAQLYLLFPALHRALREDQVWRVVRWAIVIWVARAAALGLGADIRDLTYATILGRTDQFFAGAILAWWVHRHGIPRMLGRLFPFVALGVCGVLYGFHLSGGYPGQQSWRLAWPVVEAVAWALFVGSYVAFAAWVPRAIDVGLRFVGRISYSLYMVHVIVVWIFAEKSWFLFSDSLGVSANIFLTTLTLILPLAMLVSWLTYVTIEKPFLGMRAKYIAG